MFVKPKRKPSQTLRDSLTFTEDDLRHNQQGRIGPGQMTRLKQLHRQQLDKLTSNVIAGGLLLLIDVAVVGINLSLGSTEALPGGLFLLLLSAVFIVPGVRQYRRSHVLAADIHSGRVTRSEGIIRLDVVERWLTSDYWLAIGAERWRLEKDDLLAFKNGDPYIVYTAPSSRLVLAADWLGGD